MAEELKFNEILNLIKSHDFHLRKIEWAAKKL
jgi:hypothetical protein